MIIHFQYISQGDTDGSKCKRRGEFVFHAKFDAEYHNVNFVIAYIEWAAQYRNVHVYKALGILCRMKCECTFHTLI